MVRCPRGVETAPVPGGALATPHTAACAGHGPGPGTRTVREHTMDTKLYKLETSKNLNFYHDRKFAHI